MRESNSGLAFPFPGRVRLVHQRFFHSQLGNQAKRCNFPTIALFLSLPYNHATCRPQDMALTRQIQQDWEETRLLEMGINEQLINNLSSEGKRELLEGMLSVCRQYRELLESRA